MLACPVTLEIVGSNPIGDASIARYANWQSGEAQTFVTLWVRLPPVLLNWVVFLVAACKTVVTKQARWTTRGSIPSRPTDKWPVRLTAGCEPLILAMRVQFPHGSLNYSQVVELGYTRRSERRALCGMGVRLSPWST